jgi:phosphotransferase system HPr-like phosphotransfer protein
VRHEIKVESYTREADGKVFVRVIMSELAGADTFQIISRGETMKEAMVELGTRLRLSAADANDIADKIFEQYPEPKEDGEEDANLSSQEVSELRPPLRLVSSEREEDDDET